MSEEKILLLGGTLEAKTIATSLHSAGLPVVYSIAGLVRKPDLPCNVISGGFRRHGGLSAYLKREGISALLDVTHPYATNISKQAVESALALDIPYWRFTRPEWVKKENDLWYEYENWLELIDALKGKQSVLLTAGQIDQITMDRFSQFEDQKQLLRTAVIPVSVLPNSMSWIKGIGPFSKESEEKQFLNHQIDVLVTKNSGGEATLAKINVAREHGIPVFFLKRPDLPPVKHEFSDIAKCIRYVVSNYKD